MNFTKAIRCSFLEIAVGSLIAIGAMAPPANAAPPYGAYRDLHSDRRDIRQDVRQRRAVNRDIRSDFRQRHAMNRNIRQDRRDLWRDRHGR